MRKLNILVFLSLITLTLQAQFVNNGATVTIQSGATLRVETDFTNTSGTINNNGTIEVSGNFTVNSGTLATTGNLKFITTAGSLPNVTLNTGGQQLNNVEMAKTSGHTVTLAVGAPASIAGNLSFTGTGSKIVLVDNDLTLASSTVVSASNVNDYATHGYVVTNGTGKLVKGISANNTAFVHEIGDGTYYTPVSSNVTGTYSSATLAARVYTMGLQLKYAGTTDYINREWNVVASGISSYTNTMTGTYIDGVDRVGSAALVKGATFYSGDWHFDGSAGAGNTITASTASPNVDVKLSGKNFFGKINIKAYLQGAYSGGVMSTLLNAPSGFNALETFATTSPYNVDAPASVSSGFFLLNPTIVDWVKIEVRDPNFPSTTSSNKISAFIKSNGDVVGVDGISLPVVKNVFPTSVVVLSHRNHLLIRTPNAGIDVVNPVSKYNFSSGISQAHFAGHSNPAMVDLGSGVFGLYRGNPNGNTTINATDLGIVSGQSNPIQTSVYNNSDVNLNGTVNATDLGITSSSSNPIKNAHN